MREERLNRGGRASRRHAEATRQQWDDEDRNQTKKGLNEKKEKKRKEPDLERHKNKTLSKRRLHRDRTYKQDEIVRPRLTEDSLREQIINIVT